MTSDSPLDTEITSTEAFESALGELLLSAVKNGIDPRGAWAFRTDGVSEDWEVMVLELQAEDED